MSNLYTAAAVLDYYTPEQFDALVQELAIECDAAGDFEASCHCRYALDGDAFFRKVCAEQIAYANDRRDND